MHMMKKILLLMVCCAIGAYLLLALTAFNRRPSGLCADLELVVKDSAYAGFITRSEIMSLLKKKKLNPVGRPLDSICCDILEQAIGPHPLVERAECFITPSGKVCVEVSQRVPVLRVMDSSGRDYFVDDKGSVMPTGLRCVASLQMREAFHNQAEAWRFLFSSTNQVSISNCYLIYIHSLYLDIFLICSSKPPNKYIILMATFQYSILKIC